MRFQRPLSFCLATSLSLFCLVACDDSESTEAGDGAAPSPSLDRGNMPEARDESMPPPQVRDQAIRDALPLIDQGQTPPVMDQRLDAGVESDMQSLLDMRMLTGERGEHCEDPYDLFAESNQLPVPEGDGAYTHRIDGRFGLSNDYNPIETSGLPPGCSLVYDSLGNDVVYQIAAEPGDVFSFRLTMPTNTFGSMYILDSCENGSWPDIDESGACGRAEYRAQSFCSSADCDPLEWEFTWPLVIAGSPTTPTTLFLVIDEVMAASADNFRLDWGLIRED